MLQYKSAVKTDLMEHNLPGKKLKITKGKIKISVGKYEIETMRIS